MIIIGNKRSPLSSSLVDFEAVEEKSWAAVKYQKRIPDGFLFLAGVLKYNLKGSQGVNFIFGKDYVFVQSFLPHGENGACQTRGFGRFYSLYEPEVREAKDDKVFNESAIYMALPDNKIKMILGDGEHRDPTKVQEMFSMICQDRGFQNFAAEDALPSLYEVTFKTKSCGYFLKDRTYVVWATPIGIPDPQFGELSKGWLFCDTNCGVPAVMRSEREEFIPLPSEEGSSVGLFTIRDGKLVKE